MKSQEELQDDADRAFELLEKKSPHQLAVELAHLQRKHGIAVSALNKIGVQRDQLAFQLKDATAQCGVMADLLRELREGAEIHLHNCTICKNEHGIANWTSKLERIDAALAGKLPSPPVTLPEGWKPAPVEPNAYQVLVGRNAKPTNDELCVVIYRDMIAAAPKPDGAA